MKQQLIKLRDQLRKKAQEYFDYSSVNDNEIKSKHELEISEIYDEIANKIHAILYNKLNINDKMFDALYGTED